MKYISSPQNSLIKDIIRLQEKARERNTLGLFVVEGVREITAALSNGYSINHLLVSQEKHPESLLELVPDSKVIEVEKNVFDKIAYRESGTTSAVGIFEIRKLTLQELKVKKNPLILVLETVEKPGNLGAMLRTADAAGVDAVLVCDNQTDIFNPNVIRSSLGCIFTLPVVTCTTREAIDWLKSHQVNIFVTYLEASKPYYTNNFTENTAIVMGSEAFGVSTEWIENATQRIIIPMYGKVDSMNVSNAAAIVLFEAVRQRNDQ